MEKKEAMKILKDFYDKSALFSIRTALDTVIPELKESEDWNIRKELIEYIKDQQSSFISAPDCRDKYEEEENNKYNSWIAWLEKQGEKGTKGNDREIPFDTWSEEDDEHLGRILKELENQRQRPFNRPYLDKIESDYNWLKSIKNRYTWKPSDEQMDTLAKVCSTLHLTSGENEIMESIYDALKKLMEE
jgi:hypothetical protein